MESRKIVLMNIFMWQSRDTDVKSRLVDTEREEEGGMNWESSIETYILQYVKQIANVKLLHLGFFRMI